MTGIEESTEDDTPSASGAKRQKSPSEPEKRARVIGPAPPPAPLDERPAIGPDEDDESSSSSDDDCFGPALPTGPVIDINDEAAGDRSTHLLEEQKVSRRSAKRDEWMMVPPKQDDLAARLDPTKLRARGFNTGKGAKGPAGGGGDSAMWTETPEQKLKRLQNEAMGVKTVQEPSGRDERGQSKAKDEETDRRIREHTVRLLEPLFVFANVELSLGEDTRQVIVRTTPEDF
ncbi:hypothetical protein H2203_004660 [Taxawa tesnikishii (nom. ined.)]|nr:hypothetical protein H2203_004660 [Dothideales sp. JES 119]